MAYQAMSKLREIILSKLIAFDTTSRESNLQLIHYIKEYLADYAIDSQIIYNDAKTKANLLARLGPKGNGGIMLSGHTDVVPVDGQNWTFPPFELTQSDGCYYGRGTADMKGFIACVLAGVPDFLNKKLQIPIYLAFSYDEEIGCLGVRGIVDHLVSLTEKPAICIVGEPTQMRPVYGHKGKVAVRCSVHGHACHSAYTPMGVNAIEYAAKVIEKISVLKNELSKIKDDRFDPPFSTMQVGVIEGGAALNIVPQDCHFDFEIRHLPTVSVDNVLNDIDKFAQDELVREMQTVSPASSINFTSLTQYPGLLSDTQSKFALWLSDWANNDAFSTVSFGTEAGLFNQAGVATLVCGPGSMDQGHKADEFIKIEQLDQCTLMLKKLCNWAQSQT